MSWGHGGGGLAGEDSRRGEGSGKTSGKGRAGSGF